MSVSLVTATCLSSHCRRLGHSELTETVNILNTESRTADKVYAFTFEVTCEASNSMHVTYTTILTNLFNLGIFGKIFN